jgi:hypothetical protein
MLRRIFTHRARATNARMSGPVGRGSESGYAFLMVMGMVLIMAIASQVILQNMYTEGRRAREDEMIWRGNQYVRAIRLYYRKTGHYPQTIDDLKSGTAELHFLRYAAYNDPMNSNGDGAWRFIYVNGAGQIIGSVRYANLTQMALMDLNGGKIPVGATLGSLGVPAASLASNLTGAAGASGSAPGSAPATQGGTSAAQSPSATTGDNSGQTGSQSSTSGQTSSSDQSSSSSSSSSASSDQLVNPLSLLKPTGPVDGPVIGGFLTGVGGGTSSDAASIKVVSGGKKYKDWEFIWNPLEDQARAIQSGLGALGQPNTGTGLAPPGSTNGFGNPGSMNPGFGGAVVPPATTQPQPQN